MTAADLNVRDLVQSLRSRICPLCGGTKGARKTVCFSCWRGIPKRIRDRLYDGVGEGYEQACAELFTHAGVSPASLSIRLGSDALHCTECNGAGVLKRDGGCVTSCPACGGEVDV